MTPASPKRSLVPPLLIVLLFVGPLIAAAWLYYAGQAWQPTGRSNHGLLLQPVVALNEHPGIAPLNSLTGNASDGHWVLIYANRNSCGPDCEAALYRLRQARLMLGNDMNRVIRVFLHGAAAPDRVLLEESHPGLITINDAGLGELLDDRRPAGAAAGGLYLVDPLGNLVMYFPAELDPRQMVDDIEHLLELSRIG
ncbi:MAG: hypothetical protein OEW35_19220 [Gammaproteobacteria bacterium]|nr:hypothetical protein [Gammaproteobacteria bacterium]MDH4256677.1 hypothetical protein [Gammaproteobacteria bacterium]MDH5311691.1 hypothetical protein [Gammaproteobacteria bacterium]